MGSSSHARRTVHLFILLLTIAGGSTIVWAQAPLPAAASAIAAVSNSTELDGNAVQYQSTDKDLILYFPTPVQAGSEHEVQVEYDAYPKKGLYFRTAEMGYLPEDEHLFTQGEDIEARHWIPCFDSPNEKFTSEITCHVPEKMTVLSNGHLVSEEPEANDLKRVRWLQDKPHTSYLISLVAGYLKKVEDKYRDIPLAFYTPASQIFHATNSFADTKNIMAFFEKEIGVP